jgi:Integrase core domain.
MGVLRSKNLVKGILFWPKLWDDIKMTCQNCSTCLKYSKNNQKEPLIPHNLPSHPWEKVGVDLFHFNNKKYLLVVDYYSKFFEVCVLNSSQSKSIITQFKSIFSRQGVPVTLMSDRGPPFDSVELRKFYSEWNITHVQSSPYYPKSNGLVERTIGTVKKTLQKCLETNQDPYMAMLHLRNTFKEGENSPSVLLNSRNLRCNFPTKDIVLKSKPVSFKNVRKSYNKRVSNMKKHYNKGARSLSPMKLNDHVVYQKQPGSVWLPAVVQKTPTETGTPRSYEIKTPDGQTYVRNRVYLRKNCTSPEFHSAHNSPSSVETTKSDISPSHSSPESPAFVSQTEPTCSQTARPIIKPTYRGRQLVFEKNWDLRERKEVNYKE